MSCHTRTTHSSRWHHGQESCLCLGANRCLECRVLEQPKGETKKDETLQLFQDIPRHGWPRLRKQVDSNLTQYCPIRHAMTVTEGVMFAGDRIILPSTMRTELHVAHQDMQRTPEKHCLWPGLTRDIEQMVVTCRTCQYFQHRYSEGATDLTQYPWAPLAQSSGWNLWNKRSVLPIVDYLLKYPEVLNIKDKTSHNRDIKLSSSSRAAQTRRGRVIWPHERYKDYLMSWQVKATLQLKVKNKQSLTLLYHAHQINA